MDSDYLTNFENYYSTDSLRDDYETIAIVVYYEKTWSLLTVDLKENESFFYICKDHMKEEYMVIISAILAEQLDMRNSTVNYVETFSFHSPSEAKYTGTLVFQMLLSLTHPPYKHPSFLQDFTFNQVDVFRKDTSLIVWILLTIMKTDNEFSDIFTQGPR